MYRLSELAAELALDYRGEAGRVLTGLASLGDAGPQHLSIFTDLRYREALSATRAGAVLLAPAHAMLCPVDCLLAEDAYLGFARVSALFAPAPLPAAGVHPSAVVDESAAVADDASVEAGAVIGANTVVASGARVAGGAVVGSDCRIGRGTRIDPGVILYDDVWLGEACRVAANTVLGAEGFGYARGDSGWVRIHHSGGVRIGDRVEIGAGCTVDRGTLEHTVIEEGVIIDNQVQIAHNCRVGKNTAIAGCAALAGGSIIGADCTLGGGVGVVGRARLCDGVHVTAMTLVTRSIEEPGSWSSGTAMMPTDDWKRSAAMFRRLGRKNNKPRSGAPEG